jgi:hypothetical protein
MFVEVIGTFSSDMAKTFTFKISYPFVLVRVVFIFDFALGPDVGHLVWDICPPFCLKLVQGLVKISANECYGL